MARQPIDRQVLASYEGRGMHIRNALIDAAGRKPNLNNPPLLNGQEQPALMARDMIWNASQTGADKLRVKLTVAAEELRAESGLKIEVSVRDRIYITRH